MAETLQAYLENLLTRVEGLQAAFISDKDGVVLLKASTQSAPQHIFESPFTTSFSGATEQSSKMGLGKNRSIVGIYGRHQIVQFNNSPLVISLLAEESAPTGMLMDLASEIFDVTNPIVKAYEQSAN